LRKQLLAVLIAILPIPAIAFQTSSSGRVQRGWPQAEDVSTVVRNLSDKAQDLWNAARQNRTSSSAELHMNLGAFAGLALGMSDKAEYNSSDPTLRNGSRRLVDLAKDIDREIGRGPLADEWRLVQVQLARLSDRYSLGYNPPGLTRRPNDRGWQDRGGQDRVVQERVVQERAPIFRWRGRVDGSDQIVVKGNRVEIQHLRFNPIRDASYDLPQPIPARNLELRLRKIQGRGRVEIVNQPNSWNDYSVTVLVEDADPGDDYYEFELSW
jgi:hypothetical protein